MKYDTQPIDYDEDLNALFDSIEPCGEIKPVKSLVRPEMVWVHELVDVVDGTEIYESYEVELIEKPL